MATLIVPPLDDQPWPTLGAQVCAFIEDRAVFGPGDLRGQPAVLDPEKRAALYRAYELYPKGHPRAGRRRFQRIGLSWRKGTAKTEFAAWVAYAELHPEAPVRFDGWDADGQPVGRPVSDPYVPMVSYTAEQTEELAYGALYTVVSEGPDADLFDIGLERIMRVGGDGKAVALAGSPNARDGARTTFQHFDEPLALDTPVPTPNGWSTIGALAAGDYVLGVDGRPARVLGCSPVRHGRPCYRVTFADGTSVVTDASHRWSARDRRAWHKGYQPATTETFAAEVRIENWASRPTARWAVPAAEPFELKPRDLVADPYVLGVWLGDGDSSGVAITQSLGDVDELTALVESRGYLTTRCKPYPGRAARFVIRGLRPQLRELGVFGNKHIPAAYLRGSREQRADLLAGLMDTDGHVTPGGWATFVTGQETFAHQVAELARTLGHRATINSYADNRARHGYTWKVGFQADREHCPFLLERKTDRCNRDRATRQDHFSIVSVEPIESVPVRCIGVDTEDHLFLVGDGMAATHNTHRMTLPKLLQAHETMLGNLPKRPGSDPWSLETTTAFEPGAGSVAEVTHDEAVMIDQGKVDNPALFYFHRWAGGKHDLDTVEGRVAAVREASGPAAAWADLDGIAGQWSRPGADLAYLERVWLNRTVQSTRQAFDAGRWVQLGEPGRSIPDGSVIVAGFDGARARDSTGLVICDVATGLMQVAGYWPRPDHLPDTAEWEVPEDEVNAAVAEVFERYQVWRLYGDPPYWRDALRRWSGEFGEKTVVEWWTNRQRPTAHACKTFATAITSGHVCHDGDRDLAAHIGNSRRKELRIRDEEGAPLWRLEKSRPDSPHKIDLAMCAVLAWEARGDAIASNALAQLATPEPVPASAIVRIR